MNNSCSGNFFSISFEWEIYISINSKENLKKLPQNIDVLKYLEDSSLTILREDMLKAKPFDLFSI